MIPSEEVVSTNGERWVPSKITQLIHANVNENSDSLKNAMEQINTYKDENQKLQNRLLELESSLYVVNREFLSLSKLHSTLKSDYDVKIQELQNSKLEDAKNAERIKKKCSDENKSLILALAASRVYAKRQTEVIKELSARIDLYAKTGGNSKQMEIERTIREEYEIKMTEMTQRLQSEMRERIEAVSKLQTLQNEIQEMERIKDEEKELLSQTFLKKENEMVERLQTYETEMSTKDTILNELKVKHDEKENLLSKIYLDMKRLRTNKRVQEVFRDLQSEINREQNVDILSEKKDRLPKESLKESEVTLFSTLVSSFAGFINNLGSLNSRDDVSVDSDDDLQTNKSRYSSLFNP